MFKMSKYVLPDCHSIRHTPGGVSQTTSNPVICISVDTFSWFQVQTQVFPPVPGPCHSSETCCPIFSSAGLGRHGSGIFHTFSVVTRTRMGGAVMQ